MNDVGEQRAGEPVEEGPRSQDRHGGLDKTEEMARRHQRIDFRRDRERNQVIVLGVGRDGRAPYGLSGLAPVSAVWLLYLATAVFRVRRRPLGGGSIGPAGPGDSAQLSAAERCAA